MIKLWVIEDKPKLEVARFYLVLVKLACNILFPFDGLGASACSGVPC